MIDWECQGRCRRRWEELTSVTAGGAALAPRCCGALAKRLLLRAPGIRTNDNGPRDMRVVSTAGHPMPGQTTHGRRAWDTQLGKWTEGLSAREIEREAQRRGFDIVPERSYTARHLSQEPPPPRLEDDPALLRESEEQFADDYDRAAAGDLPPLPTPLMDEQDAEGRDAAVELASEATPIAIDSAAAVEGA
jgi:hypothetical protein